jgi:hypothetical protein
MEGVGEGGCGRDFHCFSIKYNMIICADGKSEAWYQLFVVETEEEEKKNGSSRSISDMNEFINGVS